MDIWISYRYHMGKSVKIMAHWGCEQSQRRTLASEMDQFGRISLEPWNFMTFRMGRIIPTDELIFFRGIETTNQYEYGNGKSLSVQVFFMGKSLMPDFPLLCLIGGKWTSVSTHTKRPFPGKMCDPSRDGLDLLRLNFQPMSELLSVSVLSSFPVAHTFSYLSISVSLPDGDSSDHGARLWRWNLHPFCFAHGMVWSGMKLPEALSLGNPIWLAGKNLCYFPIKTSVLKCRFPGNVWRYIWVLLGVERKIATWWVELHFASHLFKMDACDNKNHEEPPKISFGVGSGIVIRLLGLYPILSLLFVIFPTTYPDSYPQPELLYPLYLVLQPYYIYIYHISNIIYTVDFPVYSPEVSQI